MLSTPLFAYMTREHWGDFCFKFHDCTLKKDVLQYIKGESFPSIVIDFNDNLVAIWDGAKEIVGEIEMTVCNVSQPLMVKRKV